MADPSDVGRAHDHAIRWFESQFERQAAAAEFHCNPFEARAIPFARGAVLDLGCGLGNFALAAAQRGATVTAVDASQVAVDSLRGRAMAAGLEIHLDRLDLRHGLPTGAFDLVVCIGLLMFFPPDVARAALRALPRLVVPGGILVVNVAVAGTTYREMFDPRSMCLFAPGEVLAACSGFDIIDARREEFAAPRGSCKVFDTVVARRHEQYQARPGDSR